MHSEIKKKYFFLLILLTETADCSYGHLISLLCYSSIVMTVFHLRIHGFLFLHGYCLKGCFIVINVIN